MSYTGEPIQKDTMPDIKDFNVLPNYSSRGYSGMPLNNIDDYNKLINDGFSFCDGEYEDLKIDESKLYFGRIYEEETYTEYEIVYDYYFEYDGKTFFRSRESIVKVPTYE